MDMSATDHEGFEVVDGSKDDRVHDNMTELSGGNRTTRKRQQGKEEEEKGAKDRSRSRQQGPSVEQLQPCKRTPKGSRSDPDDGKHVRQFLEKEEQKPKTEIAF